jgi:DNA-binding SARP family transcriptional activator/tetratricopeptide (TPR) repeat protein
MAAGTEFCLLGPLMVRSDGVAVPVTRGKQRAVLAALLLNAGTVVSLEELAEILWGPEPPPPSARVTVQNYVMRLRKALRDTGNFRIGTQPHGYAIRVDASELDVTRFETHLGAARAAARDSSWDTAAAEGRAALSLWRGEPLADVDSELLALREGPRLAEMRLQALETRIDADLHVGRHAEVITELRQLAGSHPLRERLHGLLMLALYRDGRQAEALAAYQHTRRMLIDELGTEPGTRLRELHQQVLTADPALNAEDAASAAASAVPVVPRELPAGVGHFTGRADELAALTELLDKAAGEAPRTVVISAIGGTAGIGKTALAVYWAHQNAGRFPDGQLYVNLRGFDPSGTPVAAAAAVRRFLGALGVAPASVPGGLDAQVALYRSLLAGRRMLIVLDNARDAGQVRPLLPGTASCPVLVTSRDQLAGLVAVDGAVPLTLGLLTPGEARELLIHRLGRERVSGEEGAAGELAELCARLPLALNIAAARAVLRPGRPLAALVSELRGTRQRLDPLTAGDSAADLRAVFSWSWRTLGAGAARMFGLLGLHPGPDISVRAAASLAAVGCDQARRALDELTAAHLLTEHTRGRYAFHDLLRAFAAEQAHIHDTEAGRCEARRRALDHYLRTGHAAFTVLYPGWIPLELPRPVPGVAPEKLADPEQALAWYEAEHAVLVAATFWAAEGGFERHAWQIPCALGTIMERRAYWREWVIVSEVALGAAQRSGDLTGQAHSHHRLGQALLTRGSHPQARIHLRQALALFSALGDRARQGDIYVALSTTLSQDRQFTGALTCAQRALDLYRATSHLAGQSIALNNIGWFEAQLGRYEQALASCQQALGLSRQAGEHECEALTLDSIGHVHRRLGHHAQAITAYQQALQLEQAIGDRYNYAGTLIRLGDTHHDTADRTADRTAARDAWQQAQAILNELHHPDAEDVRIKLHDLDNTSQANDGLDPPPARANGDDGSAMQNAAGWRVSPGPGSVGRS